MQAKRNGSVWRGFGSAGPRGFFASGEAGLFFDFSLAANLFQDAAGATPLTAPGQTIGLACDKSRARSPITSFAGIQASAGLRPTYGRAPKSRRNLHTISEDFSGAGWAKTAATVTANVVAAPDGSMTADLLTEDATANVHRIFPATPLVVVAGIGICHSIYVRAAGRNRVVLADTAAITTIFNLATGTVVSGVGAIANVGGGWFRLSIPRTASITSERLVVYLDNGSTTTYTGDGVSGVYVWGAQLEIGSLSAYQRAASTFDLTEAGQPSFGFARLDGADDKLTVTLPAPITGDLMLFGRNGSWIEAGVTLPSGAFDLGPTGTVLTAGVLRALGDLVGAVIIGRTTTTAERALALRYFGARGAAGWLVAGADLAVNGGFATDTVWTKGTGWSISGGVATDVAGTASVLSQAFAPAALSIVQVDFTLTRTAGSITPRFTGGTTVSGASYAAPGTYRQILIAAAGNTTLEFSADAAFAGTIDNVSVKILTPGA